SSQTGAALLSPRPLPGIAPFAPFDARLGDHRGLAAAVGERFLHAAANCHPTNVDDRQRAKHAADQDKRDQNLHHAFRSAGFDWVLIIRLTSPAPSWGTTYPPPIQPRTVRGPTPIALANRV